MRFSKIAVTGILAATIALGGLTLGCGGGAARVQQSSVTLGQELTDLQAAYEKGIITEKEYKKARKKLLKKYD